MFYTIKKENDYLVMDGISGEVYWGDKKDQMFFSSVEMAERFAYRLMLRGYEVESIEVYN